MAEETTGKASGRATRAKVRAFMVVWHRWFGLLAGVWLFLLGATGSVIVFYEEIDHLLNPQLFDLRGTGERLPYEDLVRAAEASHPGSYARFVNLPNTPAEPVIAYLAAKPTSEATIPGGLHAIVDPYSGDVLASRVFGAFKLDRLHL
ncbi:MAG: PepSY-associated TM helix domain-containing protein, partial [Acidobacteriota bacterium]